AYLIQQFWLSHINLLMDIVACLAPLIFVVIHIVMPLKFLAFYSALWYDFKINRFLEYCF
ncbi:hypothetical protein KJ693_02950, partial [bacterium]|nr:hypothetical protein [bacterium]